MRGGGGGGGGGTDDLGDGADLGMRLGTRRIHYLTPPV